MGPISNRQRPKRILIIKIKIARDLCFFSHLRWTLMVWKTKKCLMMRKLSGLIIVIQRITVLRSITTSFYQMKMRWLAMNLQVSFLIILFVFRPPKEVSLGFRNQKCIQSKSDKWRWSNKQKPDQPSFTSIDQKSFDFGWPQGCRGLKQWLQPRNHLPNYWPRRGITP